MVSEKGKYVCTWKKDKHVEGRPRGRSCRLDTLGAAALCLRPVRDADGPRG